MQPTPQDVPVSESSMRYYDLDWLRVIAFGVLIIYHAGLPFAAPDFHINNAEISEPLSWIWEFLARLRMPLLFMVAGAGVWYALGKRNATSFIKERVYRLLVPLVVGTLLIVPPQTYFELKADGIDYGSYWDFYPHFFDGVVFTGGNFTPNHLWFLYALFFYCMLSLPIFMWAKSPQSSVILEVWTRRIVSRPVALYELLIPIYVFIYVLEPLSYKYVFSFSQWLLVTLGFLLLSQQGIVETIARRRREFLIVGITLQVVLNVLSIREVQLPFWLHIAIDVPAVYCLLLAIFGYARRYLSFSSSFLRYATNAILPLYVVHQTFTVAAAYYVVNQPWSISAKFVVVVTATLVPSWMVYHFVWRPIRARF